MATGMGSRAWTSRNGGFARPEPVDSVPEHIATLQDTVRKIL